MGTRLVDFELWTRQQWPAVEVVGEHYYRDAIRQLFPKAINSDTDREVVGQAHLVCDPANRHDPNAVRVEFRGRQIGFLPREKARAYAPFLREVEARGSVAATNCRIYGYESREWVRTDRRGRDIYDKTFNAEARITLDDPHLCVPLNRAPQEEHRLLPHGNALQLRDEHLHLDVLTPLVSAHGETWVYSTLRETVVGTGKTQKPVVEALVDDRVIGTLTPAMSKHYLPVIRHLTSNGTQTAARIYLKGNQLNVEAVLYAARAHELDGTWIASSVATTGSETLPRVRVTPPPVHPKADPRPRSSGESISTNTHQPAAQSHPVHIPPKPAAIVFSAPPGWPPAPASWEPPPHWTPPEDWPAPPPGWQFWRLS